MLKVLLAIGWVQIRLVTPMLILHDIRKGGQCVVVVNHKLKSELFGQLLVGCHIP